MAFAHCVRTVLSGKQINKSVNHIEWNKRCFKFEAAINKKYFWSKI